MPTQEVLILALTYMRSGICTAGFTTERDPITGLRWVRPVKEHDTLTLQDMTDETGRVVRCGEVVALNLRAARPQVPHTEDWLTDFIYQRPRVLRTCEGERRTRLLAAHLDRRPQDVLVERTRSLCLIRPDEVWATFHQDGYSKYEARMGFRLSGVPEHDAIGPRGVPVTDLKWRALGRSWLGDTRSDLALGDAALRERLSANEIYLALGLSRTYRGQHWLMIVGVHVVPDYEMEIDDHNL